MRKLIMIIAIMFAMFTLSATPKFTLLDYNAGNTPEYVNKILKDNNLERLSLPITDKITKYVGHLYRGTWLIEDGIELALVSVCEGQTIYSISVLTKHKQDR